MAERPWVVVIATGVVDHILPLSPIVPALGELFNGPASSGQLTKEPGRRP